MMIDSIIRRIQFVLFFGLFCVLYGRSSAARTVEADVLVYGGTSGGVSAAVQAARMGKRAVIVEPGRHLGGMTSGGLSAVDIGDPRTVGGIAREYFTRLVATYGKQLEWDKPFSHTGGGPATGGAYAIEPHVAERVFNDMAREAGVIVAFDGRLQTLRKDNARIIDLTTDDGRVFRAAMFIDATYEGDLMAAAKVSYTLTREGNAKYGETYNGIYYEPKFMPRTDYKQPGPNGRLPGGQGVWDRDLQLDPYVVPGDPSSGLVPLVDRGEPGTPGQAAPGIQAYCFRLCLTTAADRLPIAPPADYDARQYELVARFIADSQSIGDDLDLRWFSKFDPLPNHKFDFNTATIGSNRPGLSWAWPEATYAKRAEIAREHENYHRGLLHFLATDPRVPPKLRNEMQRYGLPRDEFTDNGGWPHQIYVREGRRMVSGLVMTEHHTFGREIAPQSVGLGSYGTDTHEVRRIVKNGVVTREGKTAGGRGGAPPYPIGYAAIVPKPAECENLLVTFALSASHTAFSSIRMEPVLMITSQSAATAACYAIDDKVSVQDVYYEKLRARLLADKQVVAWAGESKKSPAKSPARSKPLDPAGEIAAKLEPTRTLVYKRIGDRELTMHLFDPEGLKPGDRRPCFVTIHGGGWGAGEPRRMYPFAAHYAKLGMVGISLQYRLYNSKTGVTVFDCVKDGRSAVRYLRAHATEMGIDPNKIVVNGGSAGGHVAAATALFDGVDEPGEDTTVSCVPNALVLYYPVIDTSAQGYGNEKLGHRWKELSPVDHVRPGLPPTLILHGTADPTTPFAGAARFRDEMLKAGNRCELIANQGGKHGYFMFDRKLFDEALRQTDTFLASLGYINAGQ